MTDRWEEIAERLEGLFASPTDEQQRVASALGLTLPVDIPASVAAIVLKAQLSSVLMEFIGTGAEIPESLTILEDDLGISEHAHLITGSRPEVSAWFASRYMLLTAKGLRELQPLVDDVVIRADDPSEQMVISSIGEDGRVHMKGGRGRSAWPNYLTLVARKGESAEHATLMGAVDARLRNARTDHPPSSPHLAALAGFLIEPQLPSIEAIRELEDLLESGEPNERHFQKLVERHPQLLSSVVIGNWGTYVIPQKRLGAEYVTDFLVLGVNSLGPQWVAIELEAPRHTLLTKDGALRSHVRHGVSQIQDWRDWLTVNVAYAQGSLHLHGITNQIPGLVVIGRDEPHVDRQAARSRVAEQQNIQIHSWDWLLRQAKRLVADGRQSALRPLSEIDFATDQY